MTQVTAFQVKGIGHDLNKSDGTLWYSGPAEVTYGDWEWVRVLTEHPNESETSATPGEGELQLSSYSPTLDLQKAVHETFLARQTQPSFQMQAGISETGTTITLTGAGLLSVPSAIYIGSETMKVTADNGDGTYDVVRGFWSSDAISHGVNAGVFERPPYYRWRLVTYKSFGSDGTLYDRWFGYLDERTVQNLGTQLKISCEDAYKLLSESKVNRTSPTLSVKDKKYIEKIMYVDSDGLDESVDVSDWDSNISKKRDSNGNSWTPSYFNTSKTSWPVSLHPVDGNDEGEEGIGFLSDSVYRQHANGLKKDNYHSNRKPNFNFPGPLNGYDIYEIASWYGPGTYRDASNNAIESDGLAPYPMSDMKEVYDNPNHPVAIASTILFSTDSDQVRPQELDFLNGNIGLDAGWLFGDKGKQSFIDLVNGETGDPSNGRTIEIDEFHMGYGGSPIDALNNVMELMVGAGYFFGLSDEGYPEPRRWKRLSASDLEQAEKNVLTPVFGVSDDAVWEWNPDGSYNTFVATGNVGAIPNDDKYTIEVVNLEAGSQLKRLNDPENYDYDLTWLSKRSKSFARDILQRQAEFLHAQMPTARFSVSGDPRVDSDLDLSIGAFGVLDIPENVDPALTYGVDGGILHPEEAVQPEKFAGMVIGRTWNPKTDRYIIEMMFTNYDAPLNRHRAPAAKVDEFFSGSDTQIILLRTQSNTDFAFDKEPAETFRVGQEIKVTKPALEEYNTPPQTAVIQNIDVDTDGQGFLVVDGGTFGSPDPSSGDIVTLSNYDSYKANNTTGNISRNWAFLSNDSGELGSSNEEGDVWA